MNQNKNKKRIIYLLKSLNQEYVESTMTKGRFCFNHPSVFNKWENKQSAQFDRWDSHSSYDVINLVYAPIIEDSGDKVIYGEVRKFADSAVIHEQSEDVKHTPICCFRYIEAKEIVRNDDGSIDFSLGDTAERMKKEFGHDSFILINAGLFLERLRNKYVCLDGIVVYRNRLNNYNFDVPEDIKKRVEQIFRKDEVYIWQKEYRIALQPTENTKTFIELGSIEDIAITGELDYLKGTIRLRGEK